MEMPREWAQMEAAQLRDLSICRLGFTRWNSARAFLADASVRQRCQGLSF
jgi:hypothetical protein